MTATDDQIRALRSEAAQAGDIAQVALCDLATGETETGSRKALDEGYAGGGLARADVVRLAAMSQDEARAACAEVIHGR